MARSLLRTGRINPLRAQAVLSVSTETAVYSQQAFHRTRSAADQGNGPSTGFSSLVDSNTEAATSSRDDGARQPSDHAVTERGDDANSAPTTDTAHAKGTAPARGEAKAGAGTNNNTKTNAAGANGQQQPADGSAPADAATSADAAAVIAQTTTTDAIAPGSPGPDNGKDKTTAKADGTSDGSVTDTTQPAPVDQASTLVVAVVAQVTTPNSPTPAAPNTDAVVTAVSTAPGAIAAAAASKVAADVAATEPAAVAAQPEAAAVQGQSTDTKAAVTDQAQVIVATQQSTSQSAGQTTAQAASDGAPVVQGDAAALVQAIAATQVSAPVKTDAPILSSAKITKTGVPATDAKATIDENQPAIGDPQSTKVAATDDTKAAEPIAPKKSATAIQAHETSDESMTKTQADADTPAVAPTVHQHAAVETRIAQPNTLGAADLSNANAAQVAAANAAATTPAPAATAALNTANLTVMTGQAVPLSGLAVEISANAKAGNSRFEIRLDPPDLGRIDVRLDVDKNGQVTSRLFVEKSETLDLLRRDAPQLQQALQDAGLKTSDSGLQFSLRDQNPQQGRNNGNNSGNGQNPQRLVIVEDDAATANAAGRSYGRSLSASGGVDIRV